MKKEKTDRMCLRNLTKGNVWDLQESDIFALWANADKEDDVVENQKRYMGIIRTAFDMEEVKVDKPEIIFIIITLEVFHFEISGNNTNDLQPSNILFI